MDCYVNKMTKNEATASYFVVTLEMSSVTYLVGSFGIKSEAARYGGSTTTTENAQDMSTYDPWVEYKTLIMTFILLTRVCYT